LVQRTRLKKQQLKNISAKYAKSAKVVDKWWLDLLCEERKCESLFVEDQALPTAATPSTPP